MKAANGRVVSMHYTLTDDAGNTIDSSRGRDPFVYLHGHGNIISGLETALEGAEAGFKSAVTLQPSEGYGEYNPKAVFEVPKEQFPSGEDIQVGMQVQGEGPQGIVAFTVVELTDNEVVLDGNHPLAGKTLSFDVEIITVREATDQELEHGHVHAHGHHH
jgi:FKBP-type peptidyl-prolyl cis-trans isomerase SlyD